MLSERKWFNIAFSVLLLYSLWQVWYPTYFVTGDGACHLHNAIAWKEMLLYKKSYYLNFYEWNKNMSPNYAGHLFLSFLSAFVKPTIAEKLLISTYILLLCVGWLRLTEYMNSKAFAFSLLLFPFLFQVFLFTGFYNYLLGVAGFLMLFTYYLKRKEQLHQFRTILSLSFLSVCLYFVHVMGFLFFALSMFSYACVDTVDGMLHRQKRKETIRYAIHHFLILVPALCCLFIFSLSQKGGNTETAHTTFHSLFDDLVHLKSLVIFRQMEVIYLHSLFIILFASLIVFIVCSFIKKKYSRNQQVVTLCLIILSGLYFYYPDSAMGGEMIKLRFQTILYLFLILLLSLQSLPKWIHLIYGLGFFIFSGWLIHSKQGGIRKMSRVVCELQQLEPYIHTNSFILPISFHTGGICDGNEISEEVHFSTNHLAEYLHDGKKKLVFADNYEANTNYFPLIWKPEVNPYPYFPKAESTPPEANPGSYRGIYPIQYVLIFNLTSQDRYSKAYNKLWAQLRQGFHKVSATSSAELYERNTKGLSD